MKIKAIEAALARELNWVSAEIVVVPATVPNQCSLCGDGRADLVVVRGRPVVMHASDQLPHLEQAVREFTVCLDRVACAERLRKRTKEIEESFVPAEGGEGSAFASVRAEPDSV